MDFFEQFEQARWEFTYGAPDNENLNALQVGLVAYLYIDQGYLPEKREALADAFSMYHESFGENLKWGFYSNPKKAVTYSRITKNKNIKLISNPSSEDLYFLWTSEAGTLYASDYKIRVDSPAAWYEHIHKAVSCVSLNLPIKELKDEGIVYLENFLRKVCGILKPIHGLFGIGIQNCYEEERYQHLEHEIAQEFLGVDISGPARDDEHLRNGIRSINWYTFFNDEWLAKLGGATALQSQLNDPRIALIPYDGGLIVRAGDWPELGWVKQNPYPELYVAVNRALKPIRAPEIGGMAYGSIGGEIRFDEISTAQWLRRFDVELPTDPSSSTTTAKPTDVAEPQRIEAWSGERCPHSGQWGCWARGALHHVRFQQGQTLPEWPAEQPQRVRWSLLERDDGGSCFVES